ncbi:hypothetical protein JTB14_023444 [Gonioctena quinquepunctata]|nr:hypothetical protein JTB14_023444 [Gonioctena quinquepunctata]
MYEATKILPLPQQRQMRTALHNAVSSAELSAEGQTVGSATPLAFSLPDSDDTRTSAPFAPNVQATYGHEANYVMSNNDDYNIVDVVQNVSGPTFI